MKNINQILILIMLATSSIQNSYSQSSMADHILGGMTCGVVQYTVADFDTWHEAWKNDEARRKNAEIIEKLVLQGAEDSKLVTVVFEIEDMMKAKNFFADPHTAELMQAAGVTGNPMCTYSKVSNSGIPNGASFLMVRQNVKDYDIWKQAFDNHQNVRSEYNLFLTALATDLENPSNIVAIFNSDNTNSIISFLEKSNLKEAMKDAGVTSEPIQEIMVLKR